MMTDFDLSQTSGHNKWEWILGQTIRVSGLNMGQSF